MARSISTDRCTCRSSEASHWSAFASSTKSCRGSRAAASQQVVTSAVCGRSPSNGPAFAGCRWSCRSTPAAGARRASQTGHLRSDPQHTPDTRSRSIAQSPVSRCSATGIYLDRSSTTGRQIPTPGRLDDSLYAAGRRAVAGAARARGSGARGRGPDDAAVAVSQLRIAEGHDSGLRAAAGDPRSASSRKPPPAFPPTSSATSRPASSADRPTARIAAASPRQVWARSAGTGCRAASASARSSSDRCRSAARFDNSARPRRVDMIRVGHSVRT